MHLQSLTSASYYVGFLFKYKGYGCVTWDDERYCHFTVTPSRLGYIRTLNRSNQAAIKDNNQVRNHSWNRKWFQGTVRTEVSALFRAQEEALRSSQQEVLMCTASAIRRMRVASSAAAMAEKEPRNGVDGVRRLVVGGDRFQTT